MPTSNFKIIISVLILSAFVGVHWKKKTKNNKCKWINLEMKYFVLSKFHQDLNVSFLRKWRLFQSHNSDFYTLPVVFLACLERPNPAFSLRIWLNAVFVVNETFISAVRAKAWRKRWNITGNMHSKDIFKDVLIKIARGYFILVNVLGIFYTNFTNF